MVLHRSNMLLCWVFFGAVLGRVTGQWADPCETPVVDYVDVQGETYGLASLMGRVVQLGGGYNFSVRLHTPIIHGEPLTRIRVQPSSDGLSFRVRLPSQNPRSTIKMIKYNGNVVCESEAPFEGVTSNYQLTSTSSRNFSPAQQWEPTPVLPPSSSTSRPLPTPSSTSRPVPTPSSTSRPATSDIKKDVCGVLTKPSQNIFGGQGTERGDWPWLSALIMKQDMNFFCGSTIISRNHVITAAHCMFDVNTKQQFKKENIIVALGKYDLSNSFENDVQYKQVKKTFIHENFDPLTLQNDITILLLNSPVKYTIYVRPICLWTLKPDSELILYRNATVVGWGRTENSTDPNDTPLQATVPVVDNTMCAESHLGIRENFHPELALCAGAKNGIGPCEGDSGGALMIQLRTGGMARWYLRGIVSFSPKGKSSICDLDNYSVYTDVAKYMDWIYNEMKN